MVSYPAPLCLKCKHLHVKSLYEDMITCKAFPKGIPTDIFFEAGDHTKSIKGDSGIVFEEKEDK
jgi:hypothetical protein